MNKPIFELKVNSWNKRSKYEQDKALFHMYDLLAELHQDYRKYGISDEFTAVYGVNKKATK